ncbi:type II toxin-antitoxin system RelE/ParE family toxin [Novosphingobium sp. ERN07]|uniref:type II toxin-antitoxin system RelE/ParE family toxin n=1 Tax=Novosphingobium sp. ERN07 TaxID=2726187 RepID=UPI001456B597|nr:type II toxin-antitoxin system RelE/ParE family toxin [Novosphingobium sp. ERN07]
MRVLEFSRAAVADLARIWRYSSANWGAQQADCYARELRYACRQLADGRKIGRMTIAQDGMFKLRSGAHMIYYRMTTKQVTVIRVLHAKQDVDRHL